MTNDYEYLIIGGGIAGVSAAETIRDCDSSGSIGIISEEPHILYSRVLLPAYLKKQVPRDKLFLRKPEDFTEKRIDLFLEEKTVSADASRKEVTLESGRVFSCRKLLIASGGKPLPWNDYESGIAESVYRLHSLADADILFSSLPRLREPAVVGSSFMSLEFLEIFAESGANPSLLAKDRRFFGSALDDAGGEIISGLLERRGVKMQFADEAVKIVKKRDNAGLEIETRGFRKISCDAVALAIGIKRNIEFLRGSSPERGEKGIRTNQFLETSERDVFAAGDVAEFYDVVAEKYASSGNWTNAFLQGRAAGFNMAGRRTEFRNVSSYSASHFGAEITLLGDCGEAAEKIARLDKTKNRYERLFIRNNLLVGAALINKFQDKTHLAALIANRTTLTDYHKEKLADPEFDIKTVKPVKLQQYA